MGLFGNLFGNSKKQDEPGFSNEECNQDYDLKVAGLEYILGNMYGMVNHAIIPFSIGGSVDMYYFEEHIEGTAFVTMELLDPKGEGPLPNRLGTYELISFTKHAINTNPEITTPFNEIERHACGFLTNIGRYSSMAVLNPKDTIESPNGENEPTTCLIFDHYNPNNKSFKIGEREHHLLLTMEVYREEMEFARANGTQELIDLLKEKGHYPYSDMDRKSVV